MPAALIDTNVLVYAHQPAEVAKHERANQVLERLAASGTGRLSAQILGEFVRVATRTQNPLMSIAEALRQVERLARVWPVLDITAPVVLEAVRGMRAHRLGYWDAQVWAAARLNQLTIVFSEDFSGVATLEGVRFVNPFSDDFDLERWT